jgi:hypothetical protein
MLHCFDDSVHGSGHLCGDCSIRRAAQISVVTVFGDIAFELVTEAIRLLEDGELPYFESLVWPRNVRDWMVTRSMPQNFKN